MNGSHDLIENFYQSFSLPFDEVDLEVVICPPNVFITTMQNLFEGSGILIGAQNVHSENNGAFTGETSVSLLRECGVNWCIVGHSERREHFGDTDEIISRKMEILIRHKIRPILCVGETLEQRESLSFEEVVVKQLRVGLSKINNKDLHKCVIAYEPVWAIGTGITAEPKQAEYMHKIIRKELLSISSRENAKKIKILYGGSVNPDNVGSLINIKEIDGALIGGASLIPSSFQKIIEYY
tara:strand:+ start:3451 stop:4167 length:717 start_codon:yes stop_codon:yes gene_type:complete